MSKRSLAAAWLLALFWLAVAALVAAPALAMWRSWWGFTPVAPLVLGVAAVVALGAAGGALALFVRRAWARPAATLFHVALAAWLTVTLVLFWPYSGLVARLPAVLTASSWSGVIVLLGAAVVLFSLVAAAWLAKRTTWQAFGSGPKQPGATCPTCGATPNFDAGCPFCRATDVVYHLQPLLPGARPISLRFGLGYERLHVGRGVDPREGFLDEREQAQFRLVSRQHAWLEYEPATGAVHVGPDRSEVRLNYAYVEQQSVAPLSPGDIIELGKVPFLFAPPDYAFKVAQLWPVEDPEQKTLMIFDKNDSDWHIGREECHVLIPPQRKEISRHHAAITYSETHGCYWIINLTDNNHVTVNGHDLRPAHQEQLPLGQPSTIQLATYDYIFEPMSLASGNAQARPTRGQG